MTKKLIYLIGTACMVASLAFNGSAQAAGAPALPAGMANSAALSAALPDVATLIPDFMVKESRYYNTMGYSTNRYPFTDSELTMLAIVIHREARGESYKAMLAVGNVVMNRVLASGYPGKTIEEVVTRPNQFSYSPSTKPASVCVKAARDVLHYETWVVPQNTYFFRSTPSKVNWGRHKYWKHIGNTAFYQDSYAGRSKSSNIPPAMYKRTYKWPQFGCVPSARVKKMQTMLNGVGYKLKADGWFGEGTKDALVEFQKSRGLVADGIAGPKTLRALINKYGVSKYMKLK